jgi:(heptosyl)LPS beta-1,4-glucosyltransferase
VERHRLQPTVSAVIIARDEADLIAGCLASLAWADERLVVLDTATTDDTGVLAEAACARVVERSWQGFPHQRNAALALARSDWVLFVDGDELVPPSLAHEVRARLAVAGNVAGFWIPRRNIIAGEWVRHAGWWPDRQLRLLRRLSARYDEGAVVHEVAALDGPDDTLNEPLLHLNYDTLAEFREKQTRFATLEAHTLWDRGQRAQPHNVIVQPIREFRRRTVSLGGYRQGLMGIRLGLEMARANFLTYRELLALTRSEAASQGAPESRPPASGAAPRATPSSAPVQSGLTVAPAPPD